ncbi:hypothetical protein MA16_Dca029145 [Dendrobium catenatum]|uniref:Uncharacterized protein n=1 Tax=Dendrobium catenatum TaxID=906689 RepID=A0A2I0V9Z0_9ASPA|nr:hypothetical protein MA16_Dca029145 [Dendrobium catenatum]
MAARGTGTTAKESRIAAKRGTRGTETATKGIGTVAKGNRNNSQRESEKATRQGKPKSHKEGEINGQPKGK